MSLITEPLPETVEAGGRAYAIHTDFKNWLLIGHLLSGTRDELAGNVAEALRLCYRQNLPPSLDEALSAMLRFYAGAKSPAQTANRQAKAVYDFEYDAAYILAAFWAQYGLDLTTCSLHWYTFKALFMGLGEEQKICKIMGYRGMELSQIKDKEQKKFYRRMQRLYRLPDVRSQEQRDADMTAALADAF